MAQAGARIDRNLGQAMSEAFRVIQVRYVAGGFQSRLDTGLHALDELAGGLGAGELFLLGAREGVGATSLALGIATGVARAGKQVLLFSNEWLKAEVALRLICADSGAAIDRLRSGQMEDADWNAVSTAIARLKGLPVLIDDTRMLSIDDFRMRARELGRGQEFGLVIVDDIQGLLGVGRYAAAEDAGMDVALHELKQLARAWRVPVLALSRLRRDACDVRPGLVDLPCMAQVRQHVDTVALLHRDMLRSPSHAEGVMAAEITICYQAAGRGRTGCAPLWFSTDQLTFRSGSDTCRA